MLRERSILEIGLKSVGVVLAELAEQRFFIVRSRGQAGAQRTLSYLLPYWIPDNASIVRATPYIASFYFAM
jgi:hypothetical protein